MCVSMCFAHTTTFRTCSCTEAYCSASQNLEKNKISVRLAT